MQAKVYAFLKGNPKCELLIVKDDRQAERAVDVARLLGYDTYQLPDFRATSGEDLRPYKEELFDLLNALEGFYNSKKHQKLLISPIHTLTKPLPQSTLFNRFEIAFGDRIDLDELKSRLHDWGYSFVDIVQERGEVSFRGDIIDIFTRYSESPIRLSLFDDEVESIRSFDLDSQKSEQLELERVEIGAAYFALEADVREALDRRIERFDSDSFVKDIGSLGLWVLEESAHHIYKALPSAKVAPYTQEIEELFSFVDEEQVKADLTEIFTIPQESDYKDIEIADISDFLQFHKAKKITILANSEAIVKQFDLPDLDYRLKTVPYIVNVMSKEELILSLNRPKQKRKRRKNTIVLDELKPGDYVVHEDYGVGIFKGLVNTAVLGSVRDFIEIAYQNDEKVLLPVENIDAVDRYIADGGSLAVVDRLGKGSFQKLKAKVRAKLFEIAQEIIEIAAKRSLKKAPIIESNFEQIALFQADAGFEYTEDQQRSIEEIFSDLKSGKAMDRLLSGDVGFGKTEVAMNAILAAVKSGYQAGVIAPTTLLVHQHFQTIQMRLDRFGVSIAKIDRFTNAKAKREILAGLKSGEIDLCIGTHALLGVEFNNLGLLVIDEEHKFGVKQKEKLKALRSDMHILSMSATPIPRSLNMALSSIKQYSQLLTPPSEREDVRSFVKEYNDALIKEIILREIRRGGQIFYVHNRIASIEQKKKALLDLLPDLKILVLHSKIPPATTEKEVMRFESGEYDLLLSTSIVESGIHMPNVNTIMIDEADRFGMADLHQLRGRVGRGARQGYCYFLVKDKESLSEDATKRLLALESNSFLGAGSVLAYHDLEIRGGGNLVGEAQSGHIKGIGYSLYIKMLEDALKTLMNEASPEEEEKGVEMKLAISAYISSDVVSEDRIRLELYRRLSKAQSPKEVYEIEEEIGDRFGEIDRYTKQFLEMVVIKIMAKERGVERISSYQEFITILFRDGKEVSLKARSKDDDDILGALLSHFRQK